jgi:hypothetical protein
LKWERTTEHQRLLLELRLHAGDPIGAWENKHPGAGHDTKRSMLLPLPLLLLLHLELMLLEMVLLELLLLQVLLLLVQHQLHLLLLLLLLMRQCHQCVLSFRCCRYHMRTSNLGSTEVHHGRCRLRNLV